MRLFKAKMNMKRFAFLTAVAISIFAACTESPILIEAESFGNRGGWVLDNQAVPSMGSPYLLAHGLGVPVEDAETAVDVHRAGLYHLWVRTRDWTATWGRKEAPGRFSVIIDGKTLPVTFGTEGAGWHWQDGGTIELPKGKAVISLHDLTGFEGRCDALCLVREGRPAPPEDAAALAGWRHALVSPGKAQDAGSYDLVVAGGGIAGCCAAVSAARLGLKVALIQNRPVLGGNNSSEVRVGLSGLIAQQPYPEIGNLMDELGGVGFWTEKEAEWQPDTDRSRQIRALLGKHPEKMTHNAGPASNYEDDKKLALIRAHDNIDLYLNTDVCGAAMKGGKIAYVTGRDICTGRETLFRGRLFADCTGDGTLGYLSGADFRIGRESRAETGEARAPETADSLTMGTSVQWYSTDTGSEQPFPDCPWALQFSEQTCIPITRGEWDWEAGLDRDQIMDIEYVRDHALRAVYGNWAYLKNHWSGRESYSDLALEWVAYVGGKRESRRLLGDVVLTETDILEGREFEDASFTTTWGIDLHFPKQVPGVEGEPFLAVSESPSISPYAVPYRCLYSRNVGNLFMAGRDISVTHVALGTVRVMRTGGMMGEVVGMAASICSRYGTTPRGVYERHLPELQALMTEGVGHQGFPEADAE